MYLYGMLGTQLLFLGIVKVKNELDNDRICRETVADDFTHPFVTNISHQHAKSRPFRQ